jgi:hypothetical protein
MHDNPVCAGIVERAEDYLMSSAKDYSRASGSVAMEIVV